RCYDERLAAPPLQLVTSRIILPSSAMSFSIDVDGDGRTDNQARAIVGAFESLDFGLQDRLDRGTAAGRGIALLTLRPARLSEGCAELTMASALPPGAPPRYDGGDRLEADGASPAAQVRGAILGGIFQSVPRWSPSAALVQPFTLRLPFDESAVTLALSAV